MSSAISLALPGFIKGCGGDTFILPPSDGIQAEVAAIKGNDLRQMTRDAIDTLGGMSAIVNEGETVFIKPNFVNFPWAKDKHCFHNGECTKPEIITVAEECLKAGARSVVIGEGSHLPTFNWEHAVTLDGASNLVTEAEALNKSYDGTISMAWRETDPPGTMGEFLWI